MFNRWFVPALLSCAFLVAAVDAEAQAPKPFQVTVNTSTWTANGTNSSVAFSGLWGIPGGQILVVEHVSARVLVNSEERVTVSVTCQGQALGLAEHQLLMVSQLNSNGIERLSGSSPLRCYTRNLMTVTFFRDSNAPLSLLPGQVSVEFAVSGFLEEEPK